MPEPDKALPPDYIARLQNAIRRLNHCESKYVGSVTVSESFPGFHTEKLWQAEVAIFDLYGHSQAQRAFAWSHTGENEASRYVVVLEIPPVTSPETAVQAAIAAQIIDGTLG